MKTDLLTARLLSAYSARPREEIDLSLALSPSDPEFLASVRDGYELLERGLAPGAKIEKFVRLGETVSKVRLLAYQTVTSSISIDTEGQTYFDNFLMTGWMADIMSDRYIGEPIEEVIDHPILAGNNIRIHKVSVLERKTLFVTDRTEANNLLDF